MRILYNHALRPKDGQWTIQFGSARMHQWQEKGENRNRTDDECIKLNIKKEKEEEVSSGNGQRRGPQSAANWKMGWNR